MNESIKAARLLSSWEKSNRRLVSVTKTDFDDLIKTLNPVMVAHKDGKVEFVSLIRTQAIEHLKNEYNLQRSSDIGC